MRVMREIRFSLGPEAVGEVTNSYAGWPTATLIQPYVVLQAVVTGQPDPRTGYLVNITVIDQLLRERGVPLVRRSCEQGCTGEQTLAALARELRDAPPAGTQWAGWHLKLTPYLAYSLEPGVPDMLSVTQTFEFAAAHRLHCPTMSDAENRAYFGKCNNPNGHGHNYVLEATIAAGTDQPLPCVPPVSQIEQIVKRHVIDRFDHKHLNEDCPEFRDLNPSVENIARMIWTLLDGQFTPGHLAKVRVWETAKTYAEYDGREDG
jgi:6-pyruvoyltetrahydropterin/6-carboxytetrahydropterin synthase